MKESLPHIRFALFGLRLGILMFPSFFLLDWIVYPEHKLSFLNIRLGVTAFLLLLLFLVPRVPPKRHFLLILSGAFVMTLGVSLMCYITGEGFSSPYYAGILQVIMVAAVFFNIRPRNYMFLIILVVAQHFVLLSFVPWDFRDLMVNVFAIGVFGVIGMVVHYFIYRTVEEINTLKGILPICANCKNIRDDEGYWHMVESYIRSHADVSFTHGICPDCAKELYPDLVDDKGEVL